MPKNGFLMPTAKNRFQILNLHPKKTYILENKTKKQHGLKGKNYQFEFILFETCCSTSATACFAFHFVLLSQTY